MPTALLWLRNDLRLHDHAALTEAIEAAGPDGRLLAVACLDPREYETTAIGLHKTEGFRAAFRLQALADLRARMRDLGGELVIRHALPEEVLPALAQASGANSLHLSEEPMQEEVDTAAAVRDALPQGIRWAPRWTHTLVDPDALPFELADLPDVFTQFRKAVEKAPEAERYPAPLPTPASLPPPPDGIDAGPIPTEEDLGIAPRQPDERTGLVLRGGETEGLARLHAYLWDLDRLRTYKETRNGMLHPDDSSKLSAWLSHGCLSPRRVQAEITRYEAEREKNRSTYWLTFELLWRDFFRLYGANYGDRLFWPSGPKGVEGISRQLDWGVFGAWCEGRTGLPLVDASMRELNATGFMSNRGRQNAASFLVKHLGQDWRAGASYYESLLIDYDVTSNWGNWAYVAGVGSDPRDRYFDVELQAKKYDVNAEFIQHWIPELAALPPTLARAPYRMTEAEQERYGVRIGEDYPAPILDYDRVTDRLRERSRGGSAPRSRTGKRR